MGDNPLLTILQNIISYAQGTTGKTLALVILIIGGLMLWFGMGNKKWVFGVVGGTIFIFSATWIGKTFLGIG